MVSSFFISMTIPGMTGKKVSAFNLISRKAAKKKRRKEKTFCIGALNT